MPTKAEPGARIFRLADGKPGAAASFPYDRLTVERFRAAFPKARWRDDLRAWFVPGTTAERRLDRWLGREWSGLLAYADARGRDAFAFDPIESPYLEPAEDLLVRTPYSPSVVAELREISWAAWDSDIRVWRVPYRSWDALRRRWPAIEAAARRNEPEERRRRREARKGSPEERRMQAQLRERRRRRYPVPADLLPPLDRVVMTHRGAVIFTEITGEVADEEAAGDYYPEVSFANGSLVWAGWRHPSYEELVGAWPSRWPASAVELARGWWQPTLDELRAERNKRRSVERAQARRRTPMDEA